MTAKTRNSNADPMGRVAVAAKIENLGDLWAVRENLKAPSEARWLEVDNALVDTGTTGLGLPKKLIKELGLKQFTERPMNTTNGVRQAKIYDAVKLTVQGRECIVDVTDVSANCPVLIGQVPLELLDFIVDPRRQQLIGAHGDEPLFDHF